MLPECRLVTCLKQLESDSAEQGAVGLAFVATAALNIIADLNESFISSREIACLADLILEFRREGHDELLEYLMNDMPDCAVCAALATHLRGA